MSDLEENKRGLLSAKQTELLLRLHPLSGGALLVLPIFAFLVLGLGLITRLDVDPPARLAVFGLLVVGIPALIIFGIRRSVGRIRAEIVDGRLERFDGVITHVQPSSLGSRWGFLVVANRHMTIANAMFDTKRKDVVGKEVTVYALPKESWSQGATGAVFRALPIYDSPMLIAEKLMLRLDGTAR